MATLHTTHVIVVVISILALSELMFLYWTHNPIDAQRRVWRVFKFLRRIAGLPLSLVVVTVMMIIYWMLAIATAVLNTGILGKPTRVKVKIETE